MTDFYKRAAPSMGSSVGVGAGGGALVGALATLFDENPDARELVKNTLIGGGAGALAGGSLHAMSGSDGGEPTPTPSAPPDSAIGGGNQMSLPISAVSGVIPGIGPAAHSIAANPDLSGVGQAVGSGVASLGGARLAIGDAAERAKAMGTHIPGKTQALGFGASILAALGAAAVGNKLRGGADAPAEKSASLRRVLLGGVVKSAGDDTYAEPAYTTTSRKGADGKWEVVDHNEGNAVTHSGPTPEEATGKEYDGISREEGASKDGGAVEKPEKNVYNPDGMLGEQTGYVSKMATLGGVTKSAAKMVRKTELVEENHDHCPHCDFEFREKTYPVMKGLPEDEGERKKAIEAGEYDEHCPECGGLIDQEEMTDEEIEKHVTQGFFAQDPEFAEQMRRLYTQRRDNQRRRRKEREKSASNAPSRKEIEKEAVVKKEGDKWKLYTKDGERVLGTHDTAEEAYAQEYAIEKSQERRGEGGPQEKEASLRQARNDTHTDPTPAQATAGNYKKGEFSFKGITLKIENPKGTERRGYNKLGAVTWRSMMRADYGYVKGTEAIDGDAVDVFVGPDMDSDLVVAVDQYKDAGNKKFDETKFIFGVKDKEQGEKLYLKHYPRGWKLGPTSTTTIPQFKEWLKNGEHKKPFKGQMVKTATGS